MNEDIKKIIVDELKAVGLDIAEDAAVNAAKALLKALPKVLMATQNKADDMLIPLVAIVEPKIMEALDKIDGQVG